MSFVPVPGTWPPRFSDVPENQKWPIGRYKQAPSEYGGNWWYVSPFTGTEPWVTQGKKVEDGAVYPDGFLETFGPRPQAKDFVGTEVTYQEAIIRWEQDLKYFKQAGLPEWISTEEYQRAADTFKAWDMGKPRVYEGRYGWSVRFPDSKLRFFESSARAAIQTWTHGVIAHYQVEAASQGFKPDEWHPFVPPYLRGD